MSLLKLFSTILLLSIPLSANSDGQTTQSSAETSKVPKIVRTSGNRSPFGFGCAVPGPPINGRVRCIFASNEQTCTGECFDGYQFPGKNVDVPITCGRDGISRPVAKFPNCQPVCDSPCQNGGTCVGVNECRCQNNFWGKLCETPVSVCNLHRVGYKCKIKKDLMICSLVCGQGLKFENGPHPEFQTAFQTISKFNN